MASFKAIFLSFIFLLFTSLSSSFIVLPLQHTLNTTHFPSIHHLLKATTSHSTHRFRSRHEPHRATLSLSKTSAYTLSLTLATLPPQPVSLLMDTGSDLVWVPCEPFTCALCEDEDPPAPVRVSSRTAVEPPCNSPLCSAAHSRLPPSDLCAIAGCPLVSLEMSECFRHPCPPFYYAYGDGSLVGRLFSNPISLPPFLLSNFTFACSHSSLGEPVGVAGFGMGSLSLLSQLNEQFAGLGSSFSYCLVPHGFSFDSHSLGNVSSPLIIGRLDDPERELDEDVGEFVFAPFLHNPKNPNFYTVSLKGVAIGGKSIPAPEIVGKIDGNGTGGMVIDSGTTFTMLPSIFHFKIVTEFEKLMGGQYDRAREVEDGTGLKPCYYEKGRGFEVPELAMSFAGEGVLVLPRENYFYEFEKRRKKVGCFMVIGIEEKEIEGGPGAIFGSYQQQGLEVLYDVQRKRVGFAQRRCQSLL